MLIAREAELGQVTDALSEASLVTLTGPGGVGKTTLARAVIAERSDVGSTCFLADLASLDDRRFQAAVAGDLGFASVEELIEHLSRQTSALIVLDNCEHVLDPAADLVSRFLVDCPDVNVLATSRERIDLPEELVVPLGPLSTAGPSSDARAMFEAVARRHGVNDLGDPTVVSKLVDRLDGLPLALELAAARTVAMTPSEILRHVDVKLDILSRARNRGPQRHRSLQATIAWSYQLLADSERRLLNRLSAIPPPFTQQMALAVGLSGNHDDDDRVGVAAGIDGIDALTRLVDQSLLVCETHGRQSWYRMLDTIRVYATERLGDEERAECQQRLIDHVEQRAVKLEADLHDGSSEPLAELGRTFRSRVQVIDQLCDQGASDRCLRLMSGMWWLEDSGHQGEVVEVIERVLDGCEYSDDNAEAYAVLAVMYRIAGRHDESRSVALQVIAHGNDSATAFAHRTLGLLSRAEGDWQEAEQHFERGAEAAQRAGKEDVALEVSMHGALTRWRSGDLDGALELTDQLRRRSSRFPNVDAWIAVFQTILYMGFDPGRARTIAAGLAVSDVAATDQWVAGWCSIDLAMAELLEHGDDGLASAAQLAADGLGHFIDIENRTDIVHPLLVAAACAVRAGLAEDGFRIAATALHAYPQVVFGPGEQDLMDRLGAPLSVDAAHPRMTPKEAIEVLRRISQPEREIPSTASVEPETSAQPSQLNQLRRDGDGWLLSYRGRTGRVRDTKGMATVARLVTRPNVEIAAVDLMGAAVIEQASGVIADRAARDAYRERVRELHVEIDEATDYNDPARAERAQVELDRLVEELQTAYGLGGSERATGSTAERARTAVRWRIRDAVKRIESVHPTMGAHLDRSISTGRFCVYRPAEPTVWRTG